MAIPFSSIGSKEGSLVQDALPSSRNFVAGE